MRTDHSPPSRLPNTDFREFLGGAIIALSGMMSARCQGALTYRVRGRALTQWRRGAKAGETGIGGAPLTTNH